MKAILRVFLVGLSLAFAFSASANDFKVAYLPCGQVNDNSWSQVGYTGMKMAQEALAASGSKMTLEYSESIPPAQIEAAARDYAARGFEIVVLHCGTFGEAAVNAAKAFPHTIFLLSTVPPEGQLPPNFWAYDASQQETTFMAGVLAGSMSKSGTVAAIGGFAFPALARQMEGFMLGARYANPKTKILSTYINSFDDATKAKEAAQAQIDSGADVLFAATDQAARGVFAAAQDAHVYAIASYSDQASLAPTAILASVIYDYAPLVKSMVINAHEHKLEPGKFYMLEIAGGVGTMILNPKLENAIPQDTKQNLTNIRDDIKAGKLKIPNFSKPGQSAAVDLKSLRAQ